MEVFEELGLLKEKLLVLEDKPSLVRVSSEAKFVIPGLGLANRRAKRGKAKEFVAMLSQSKGYFSEEEKDGEGGVILRIWHLQGEKIVGKPIYFYKIGEENFYSKDQKRFGKLAKWGRFVESELLLPYLLGLTDGPGIKGEANAQGVVIRVENEILKVFPPVESILKAAGPGNKATAVLIIEKEEGEELKINVALQVMASIGEGVQKRIEEKDREKAIEKFGELEKLQAGSLSTSTFIFRESKKKITIVRPNLPVLGTINSTSVLFP